MFEGILNLLQSQPGGKAVLFIWHYRWPVLAFVVFMSIFFALLDQKYGKYRNTLPISWEELEKYEKMNRLRNYHGN